MPARKDAWFFSLAGGGFILLVTLPFLWAYSSSGPQTVFGGFLFNPIDGYSYLAKMQAGYLGGWRYSLPYTLEHNNGAFLFIYYIILGHLARLAGLPLAAVFHLARLAGAVLMLLALWRFFTRTIPQQTWQRLAFVLALFTAGLGWLAMAAGLLTADLWVAEAYPFLSAYANPHFPLGLALLVYLLTPVYSGRASFIDRRIWVSDLVNLLAGLALALVLPFGLLLALAVLVVLAAWDFVQPAGLLEAKAPVRRSLRNLWSAYPDSRKLLAAIAGGLPVLLYDQWVVHSDPFFKGWNAQNLTISPDWWDILIAFLPVLLLALPAAWRVARGRQTETRVLLVWAVVGFLLVYLPFGLQRRFFTGLMIPLSGLAALGLQMVAEKFGQRTAFVVAAALFALAMPTTLINLLVGLQGIHTHDPLLYIRDDEMSAFRWLAANTPPEAGVLASPQTGLQVPAYSGRRVLYGHPFESLEAENRQRLVERLFAGDYAPQDLQVLAEVDYIYYGPREQSMGTPAFLQGLEPVWQHGQVAIYRSPGSPVP